MFIGPNDDFLHVLPGNCEIKLAHVIGCDVDRQEEVGGLLRALILQCVFFLRVIQH